MLPDEETAPLTTLLHPPDPDPRSLGPATPHAWGAQQPPPSHRCPAPLCSAQRVSPAAIHRAPAPGFHGRLRGGGGGRGSGPAASEAASAGTLAQAPPAPTFFLALPPDLLTGSLSFLADLPASFFFLSSLGGCGWGRMGRSAQRRGAGRDPPPPRHSAGSSRPQGAAPATRRVRPPPRAPPSSPAGDAPLTMLRLLPQDVGRERKRRARGVGKPRALGRLPGHGVTPLPGQGGRRHGDLQRLRGEQGGRPHLPAGSLRAPRRHREDVQLPARPRPAPTRRARRRRLRAARRHPR